MKHKVKEVREEGRGRHGNEMGGKRKRKPRLSNGDFQHISSLLGHPFLNNTIFFLKKMIKKITELTFKISNSKNCFLGFSCFSQFQQESLHSFAFLCGSKRFPPFLNNNFVFNNRKTTLGKTVF